MKQLELENQRSNEAQASTVHVEEQERRVADFARELKAKEEVVAPYTGRILEVLAERGNVVAVGEPILTLDLTGRAVKDLEAVIYVASLHGKQIRPGMEIQIAPSTVKREEYGLMVGRVTYVSDFPATSKGMRRVLRTSGSSPALGTRCPVWIHADRGRSVGGEPLPLVVVRGPPVASRQHARLGQHHRAEKRDQLVIPLVQVHRHLTSGRRAWRPVTSHRADCAQARATTRAARATGCLTVARGDVDRHSTPTVLQMEAVECGAAR